MNRKVLAVLGTAVAAVAATKAGLDIGPFNSFAFLVTAKLGLKPLR